MSQVEELDALADGNLFLGSRNRRVLPLCIIIIYYGAHTENSFDRSILTISYHQPTCATHHQGELGRSSVIVNLA